MSCLNSPLISLHLLRKLLNHKDYIIKDIAIFKGDRQQFFLAIVFRPTRWCFSLFKFNLRLLIEVGLWLYICKRKIYVYFSTSLGKTAIGNNSSWRLRRSCSSSSVVALVISVIFTLDQGEYLKLFENHKKIIIINIWWSCLQDFEIQHPVIIWEANNYYQSQYGYSKL